jgi:DNA repair exonuclease SbcCD ATPase subunit
VAYSAPPPGFKVTNEMIYQKLIEIEQRQAIFDEKFKQIDKRFEQIDRRFEELREDINRRFEDVDKRFEDINRRFEDINRRFEDMNKRFEDINKRFEQLYTFLWIITGIFTAIMVGAFGFAYWDRRTIIAEAKRQTLEELERDVKPEKLRKLLNVAREFARENEKFREILKKEGLL